MMHNGHSSIRPRTTLSLRQPVPFDGSIDDVPIRMRMKIRELHDAGISREAIAGVFGMPLNWVELFCRRPTSPVVKPEEDVPQK